MEKMRLFVGTICPYCTAVKNFIAENNIEGIEIVNINKDKEARDYLLEKGGMQQVPCLFVGDKPIYESQDIMNYLREKFL